MDTTSNNCDQSDDECPTRPISLYDNSNSSGNQNTLGSNSYSTRKKDCYPSQTHCLNTTVPQNITLQDFSGKHTPTRNSLRHSRMIVMNKSGQIVRQDVSSFLKYQRLAKWLKIGISLLGIMLCMLSLWLLVWSPNIRKRDNPYWSALPVISSGFVGIFYLLYCLKERPNKKLGYFFQAVKYISISSSVVATVASSTVFFFSLVHIVTLNILACSPPDNLNKTCVCSSSSSNSTEESIFTETYHYVDLSCMEVNKVLHVLVVVTCIANVVIVFLELLYLYLHWLSRNVYVYSRVPMNVGLKTRKSYS